MRVLWPSLVVLVVGCAGSRARGTDCDPASEDCAAVDAAVVVDSATGTGIDAAPDAMLRGFGEACTDGDQCTSDICILGGTSGYCSQLCGECPPGYGCLGVLGAIDPDVVAFVCVKTSDQLCSPCQQDSECTLLGMDKCLTEATGRSYCSRDCSSVSCPTGYDCESEQVGGAIYKQCVPHSQACDCQGPDEVGDTDACAITTPLATTCAGARTCGGATGWGACLPPSPNDAPDGEYKDDNCDGIDGDLTKGIFVSGAGANSLGCGLTFTTPCSTISFGLVRAFQTDRRNVYVQAGTYNEVVTLVNGISVWGGYDFRWQRGPYTNAANRVTVIGNQDNGPGGDGEFLTVRARDLNLPVTIGDLVLVGPTAQGVGGLSGLDGRSSYVVHAKGSVVSLVRVQLVAGNGAAGGTGGAGLDAPTVDPLLNMFGSTGGNGDESSSVCNSSSRGGGGVGGANSCTGGPSARDTNGAAGGRGGTKDTDCGLFSVNLNARAGDGGASAAVTSGVFGTGGAGGTGSNTCGPPGSGRSGVIVNGGAGGAGAGGYLGGPNNFYWYARAGGGGGTGANGGGGGGGGGSGGCDNGTDAFGAGGSGGGAGGCAARGGGSGGGGGGGAFGIVAVGSSAITVAACDLVRGAAGAGGTGGSGGRGQSGARGADPNPIHPGSAVPGRGGDGAHGGHGGGGGGGQGGRSAGILATPESTITGSCAQSAGVAGGRGAGGSSAPSAPSAERDGNSGSLGSTGTLEDTRRCASGTSC